MPSSGSLHEWAKASDAQKLGEINECGRKLKPVQLVTHHPSSFLKT